VTTVHGEKQLGSAIPETFIALPKQKRRMERNVAIAIGFAQIRFTALTAHPSSDRIHRAFYITGGTLRVTWNAFAVTAW
jgi:hypothetical protein